VRTPQSGSSRGRRAGYDRVASSDSQFASHACWRVAKSDGRTAVTPSSLTPATVGHREKSHFPYSCVYAQSRSPAWMTEAWAAATRAIGTRNGEQDT
jgi:hypothetical protein